MLEAGGRKGESDHLMSLAANHMDGGDLDEAERLYVQVAQADPARREDAIYHLAVCSEQRGDFDRADRYYVQAQELWFQKRGTGARADKLLLRIQMGKINLLDEWGHEKEVRPRPTGMGCSFCC
jgi:tetratricopeptide (TPR) repeat protein